MNRYAAEGFGTFALVFAGTGAIVVNDLSGGAVTHLGIALTFGFIVASMIYALGDISGAHFNPAVTLGFWLARRLPGREVAPYVASQVLGALAASGAVRSILGAHPTLGATLPSGAAAQSFVLEVMLSLLLVFTILSVSTGARERGVTAGFAVGAVVALCALFGGPISGASMNPARSIGPAVLSGQLGSLWLYLLAPAVGAGLAVGVCRCTRGESCCTAASAG